MKKNNKGVTLIALIIMIIVIIILAAVVISGFNYNTEKASSAKILNEFVEIENAVNILGKMHTMDRNVHKYIGTPLSSDNVLIINYKEYGDGFYYLEQKDLIELGVNGATRNYVVNYVTGEVVATEPFIIGDKPIYNKADIVDAETGGNIVGEAEYDEAKGVNKPILYSGMIPVKISNGGWVVCSKDDREWYDYVIGAEGPNRWANVMLLDDLELRNPSNGRIYSNEDIRGMKATDLVGMEVVSDGSMFVWIPRYTYKEATGEVVYSRLTQDYLQDDYIKAPAFYNGEYSGGQVYNGNAGYVAGGKELTGIWISKYQASYVD